MDDGPRTGALQLLLLLVGAACAYLTVCYAEAGPARAAVVPALLALGSFYGIYRTERYARRRSRAEAEARERDALEAQFRQPSAPRE
ncbi:MAG TPA: hypothetical protein VFG42_15965 [Baekduia sp.]|uniref:hypothetical protein n=1 Tax=Baekduia sp. TaxID=2600305 RepID=UPI002D787CF5|nr:hypothetical protein [Baekduia sp.]HET6508289.1 hypothetical protein [Baekduia sp.]